MKHLGVGDRESVSLFLLLKEFDFFFKVYFVFLSLHF
jgi:hypothetical protein